MKRAVFFDVDGTLFDNKNQNVPASAIEAIKKLKDNPNVILGLATGRSANQLEAIDEIKHLFEYKILINGAVAYKNDELIYENKIEEKMVNEFVNYLDALEVATGYVSLEGYSVSRHTKCVKDSLDDYQMFIPAANPRYHLDKHIYQLWIFDDRKEIVQAAIDNFKGLRIFPWHKNGADVLNITSNKGNALLAIKEAIGANEIICFGDGLNDFELIDVADIGVVMNNAGSQALKDKADMIAPNIDEDGIYKACIKLGLFE